MACGKPMLLLLFLVSECLPFGLCYYSVYNIVRAACQGVFTSGGGAYTKQRMDELVSRTMMQPVAVAFHVVGALPTIAAFIGFFSAFLLSVTSFPASIFTRDGMMLCPAEYLAFTARCVSKRWVRVMVFFTVMYWLAICVVVWYGLITGNIYGFDGGMTAHQVATATFLPMFTLFRAWWSAFELPISNVAPAFHDPDFAKLYFKRTWGSVLRHSNTQFLVHVYKAILESNTAKGAKAMESLLANPNDMTTVVLFRTKLQRMAEAGELGPQEEEKGVVDTLSKAGEAISGIFVD